MGRRAHHSGGIVKPDTYRLGTGEREGFVPIAEIPIALPRPRVIEYTGPVDSAPVRIKGIRED